MAKKEAARSIVLNVMYNGKYLNENMGHHEKYTIISYKTLWNAIKDAGETNGDALKKHTYSSVPESRYEEMKSLFFRRIIDNMVAGMNL